jgi:hypothetical protein
MWVDVHRFKRLLYAAFVTRNRRERLSHPRLPPPLRPLKWPCFVYVITIIVVIVEPQKERLR